MIRARRDIHGDVADVSVKRDNDIKCSAAEHGFYSEPSPVNSIPARLIYTPGRYSVPGRLRLSRDPVSMIPLGRGGVAVGINRANIELKDVDKVWQAIVLS